MKISCCLLVSLLLASQADARIRRSWTYLELLSVADAVVIAVPVAVEVLEEVSPLPDIATQLPDGRKEPVRGRGINTSFEIVSILRGEPLARWLILHHYQRAEAVASAINGPGLVRFDPSRSNRYLMFLKKESDVRFVPASGQTDPYLSISEISGATDDRPTGACTGLAKSASR